MGMGKTRSEIYKRFIKKTKAHCARHGVTVYMFKTRYPVDESGTQHSGIFCGETKQIRIAAIGRVSNWFFTYVHEYNHFLQWLHSDPHWQLASISNGFDCWIQGGQSIDPYRDYLNILLLELDCEQRSFRTVKSLGLNYKKYAQEANAYLYYFHFCYLHRSYARQAINYSKINKLMPKKLVGLSKLLNPPKYVSNLFKAYF